MKVGARRGARCLAQELDGRACTERCIVIDSRPGRDDLRRPIQLRVVECPVHGLRNQAITDDGPTVKRRLQ